MKILPRLCFALFAGVVIAGWFWALGCPFEPGQKLGLAYCFTIGGAIAAFVLAPVKNWDC